MASAATSFATPRKWPLGLNTYCLRFQRWNNKQLMDYWSGNKLDVLYFQEWLDGAVMDPKYWYEVMAWSRDFGLDLATGGGAILLKPPEASANTVATLRKNIERASA